MKVIIVLVIGFGLPLILQLLIRKLAPYRPNSAEPPITKEDSRKWARQVWWIHLIVFAWLLVGWFGFTWICMGLLILLSDWDLAEFSTSLYLIKPTRAIWLSPGLFLGLLCWALTVVPLYRWLLGDKYDAYSRWYSRWHGQQFGFDGNSKKLLVGLVGLFLGFPAFMIVFGSNWHLRVEENSIGWKRFLSFTEKQYSYDEIDKIVETSHARAPMGNVGECARIFLVFSDGNKWSFEDMGYSYARGEYDREMIQYIQNRSGKPLIHATFIEDVAP
jgi:hypothetical protein